MEDLSASYRANAIDHERGKAEAERAKAEAELDEIAHRVLSTQRHNLLLKIAVCLIPVGGCGGGLWLQTLDQHSFANAGLLGGGLGLAAAVFLLKKFERPIPMPE